MSCRTHTTINGNNNMWRKKPELNELSQFSSSSGVSFSESVFCESSFQESAR
jgi:hypothetical protein